MSDDGELLLAAIMAHPEEDTPRLVYADWLQEQGDPDRADFIRLQISGLRNSTSGERLRDLRRAHEILGHHWRKWQAPLDVLKAEVYAGYSRGFPRRVRVSARVFLENSGQILKAAPAATISLNSMIQEESNALWKCPDLQRISSLDFHFNLIGDRGVRELAESPNVRNLTTLSLRDNQITDDGLRILAEGPHLRNLTTLDLRGNQITGGGLRALAASKTLWPDLIVLTTNDPEGENLSALRYRLRVPDPHVTVEQVHSHTPVPSDRRMD